MSIDYSFGVAFGFILNVDEYRKYISDETEDEVYARFEDMTIRTDCYDDDGDYIWAFDSHCYGCIGAEKYKEDDLKKEVTPEELEEFYNLFPHRRGEQPSVIVYNEIY